MVLIYVTPSYFCNNILLTIIIHLICFSSFHLYYFLIITEYLKYLLYLFIHLNCHIFKTYGDLVVWMVTHNHWSTKQFIYYNKLNKCQRKKYIKFQYIYDQDRKKLNRLKWNGTLWNVTIYGESNWDGLEQNVSQHDNTVWNVMEVNGFRLVQK